MPTRYTLSVARATRCDTPRVWIGKTAVRDDGNARCRCYGSPVGIIVGGQDAIASCVSLTGALAGSASIATVVVEILVYCPITENCTPGYYTVPQTSMLVDQTKRDQRRPTLNSQVDYSTVRDSMASVATNIARRDCENSKRN